MTTRIDTNTRMELLKKRLDYLDIEIDKLQKEFEPLKNELELLEMLNRLYLNYQNDSIDSERALIFKEEPTIGGPTLQEQINKIAIPKTRGWRSTKAGILEWLSSGPASALDLIAATNLSKDTIHSSLRDLLREGRIERVSRGVYQIKKENKDG